MSPRFVLGRENVPCVAEVVNRSLKADCTDFNCGLALTNKLQSLQNRAARVVTRTKYGCVEPDQLLKNLRRLSVQQLIDFDTAVMVHKSINDKAPPYLTSLFLKIQLSSQPR